MIKTTVGKIQHHLWRTSSGWSSTASRVWMSTSPQSRHPSAQQHQATMQQQQQQSYVVKAPVHIPELKSNLMAYPLTHFILRDFLDPNKKNRVATVDGSTEKTLTFEDIYYLTHSMADSLRDMSLKKDDVCAIVSPNHIHYSTAFLGISLAGCISTTVNPLYSEGELTYQFEVTKAKIVFAHPLCLDKVLAVANGRQVILMDDGITPDAAKVRAHNIKLMSSMISADRKKSKHDYSWSPDKFNPDSIVTIPFSSGTTGKCKGVMLSHRNLVANVLQTVPYEGKFSFLNSKGDRGTTLVPLPYFHIYGLTLGVLCCFHYGSKNIFMPAFDLQKFLELVQKHKVKRAFVVPPIILGLAKHPIVDKYDTSTLKCLISGAAPLGSDVQVACAIRLKCLVKQAWGMTELSPAATITPDDMVESVEKLQGTSGPLVPGMEGKIVDPQTGKDLPPDQEGEILMRGPNVMLGYYNDREATSKMLTPDGWLHTGDIGRFDEKGWLYVTDRVKELIKYKGFQVPPAELEAIIASMPQVKDVIVIPVLDDEAGEVPRAYVVKQDSAPKDFPADAVIHFVESRVAPHKRLRGGVIFTDTIPKSLSGKLLRRVQIEIDRKNHAKK